MLRFLNIFRAGVMKDDERCPNAHVLIDEGEGYKICYLCYYGTVTRAVRRASGVCTCGIGKA
jgi:hypothetical protein